MLLKHPFSLPSEEKLKSSAIISSLFDKGSFLSSPPVRLVWQFGIEEGEAIVKVAFTVSKKSFKRAVDRNLLKRRMRESYRKNKNILECSFPEGGKNLHLLFIYSKTEILHYTEIENGVKNLLEKLNKIIG